MPTKKEYSGNDSVLSRQRREQLRRSEKGICQTGGCLAFIDSDSKALCTYCLNRRMETKQVKGKGYLKARTRLALESQQLDDWLLEKAGFKTRQDALKMMHILNSLTQRLAHE